MGQVVRVTLPRVPTQKTKWTLRWREVKIICGGGEVMMMRLSGEMREPHASGSYHLVNSFRLLNSGPALLLFCSLLCFIALKCSPQ